MAGFLDYAVFIIILIGMFAIAPILFNIIRKIHFLLENIVETWHHSLPWNRNIQAPQQGWGGIDSGRMPIPLVFLLLVMLSDSTAGT
jgi:hypothetical protein